MPITVSQLYHDTRYFFYKQIRIIIIISFSVTCFNTFIDTLFKPDIYISSIIENKHFINTPSLLELMKNINLYENREFLKYSIIKMIEWIVSKTILIASLITFILHLSKISNSSIFLSIYYFFSLLPNLFILNFLISIITQLGFIVCIFPGILLSIILPLSTIIFSIKKNSLMNSIRMSIYLSWKYIKIVGPGILFWILGKFSITILFLSYIYFINLNIAFFLLNISINVLFSILIIYLCRFYMICLYS